MSQYRIVKMKHCEHSYKVEKKIMGFWFNTYYQWQTLVNCEFYIQDTLKTQRLKKDNPRDIIVKTY